MKKVLVIHPDDRSTDMLKAVYEGKGYDVITDLRISDDEEIAETLMPLMHAMHDTIEMEDLQGMKRIILERYNANDPVTWFNRRNIFIL